MLEEPRSEHFGGFNSCSLQRSRSDLDLVELLREKALKEILPLMEKDERNLKDRRPKSDKRFMKTVTCSAVSRWGRRSALSKQYFCFALDPLLYFLCALFISVLCSGKRWTVSHSAGSYQHVGGPGHQWESPVALTSIPDQTTEDSCGIIENHRNHTCWEAAEDFTLLMQIYQTGLPWFTCMDGFLTLWSMTWMHDVACVSRVVLFDGHLGTSPYSPSSRQCHGGSRWYKLFPRSSMILHCFEIHGSYGLRMASARHGSMNLPWYSLSSTSLCGHLRRIILPLSATCLAFSLPFSLRRGDLATHWSLELPLSSPYGLDSGPPRLDYFFDRHNRRIS